MNHDDQFEKRLQRQPPRELPAAWRSEILAAANAVNAHPPRVEVRRTSWWRELLWPCPQAWAGLGAAWLLIVGCYFGLRETDPAIVRPGATQASRQMRELLKQQEQLFVELTGSADQPDVDRPRSLHPTPHSSRRAEACAV